jgi:formate/nitrite transporter
VPSPSESAFDALLPPDMALRAEEIGAGKAAMEPLGVFVLAVLAGAFIGLGAVFSTVALAGAGEAPWGPVRILAGLAFSLGLVLVVVGGAELFTGNNLVVMAWAANRIKTGTLFRSWAVVYAGNFVGALSIAVLVAVAGTHRLGAGAFGTTALGIAHAKLGLALPQAVALGILCNLLVCLAVWLSYSARTTADRILAVILPISAFVAAGFEHSVANMYFVPFGLLVTTLDPGFVAAHGLGGLAEGLTWSTFFVRNLAPVTIGNVIGGAGLVGAVYWFVYLRAARP